MRSRIPVCVALALALSLLAPGLAAQSGRVDAPGRKVLLWSVDTRSPSFGSGAAADLDGDGKLEVLFGCYFGDETFRALDGRSGKILFERKSRGGPLDASVLAEDLNGDGKPELVFGDSAYGRIWCLDGAGRELWTFDGPSGTDSPPAAADLDGDGTIEIVYGTMKVRGGDGRVVVLEGATGKERWSVPVPGHVQSEPGLADLNGDGVLDVLVTNWMGDDKLRALDGRGGEELWRFSTEDWVYHGVSVADLDGDGRLEVVVADRRGGVFLLRGETGDLIWEARLEGERKGSVFGPTTLVDSDGEGALEIAVCGQHLHLLDARGKLRWRREFGPFSIARGASAADIDGDGRQDLVFGSGSILRALRARDGRDIWAYDLATAADGRDKIDNAPLLVDLDGDGRLDVFVVVGRGTSGQDRPNNRGRAWALRAGKGKASPDNGWTTFRGSNRRLGTRPVAAVRERKPRPAASGPERVDADPRPAAETAELSIELALDSGVKLGGCAIGDVDPDHPGNEVVAVAEDGRVFVCRRTEEGWFSEVVHQAPGELIQVAIGDADPESPGLEIVAVGVASGGEGEGGAGAVSLIAKTRRGWKGGIIFSDSALVHGAAVGRGEIFCVGYSLAVHRLTPKDEGGWEPEVIGATRSPGKNALLVGGRLLVCCTDGRLLAFERGTGLWAVTLVDQQEAGRARIGAAGDLLVVADDDGCLRVLDGEKAELLHRETRKLRGAVFADLDPNSPGLEIGTVGYEGKLTIFRGAAGARRASLLYRDLQPLHHLAAGDLDGLPGDELAACGYAGRVVIVRARP